MQRVYTGGIELHTIDGHWRGLVLLVLVLLYIYVLEASGYDAGLLDCRFVRIRYLFTVTRLGAP